MLFQISSEGHSWLDWTGLEWTACWSSAVWG